MMGVVQPWRILVLVLYAAYLTNVGMLLVMLPWSEVWGRLVLLLPYRIALVLDLPALRGIISAFGMLHFVVLLAELVVPDGIGQRRS